ncbi:aminotransferase class I/II-fold pyridoxal phosphate-dependent enzyme [Streptomyces sp. BRB040]|uniref:aminotransferase class I/II-fold pyridoxal phosphate-dependent enzyme n=1 Tax=Streptomyces sp. BRB040 TaxID=3142634 RepID=UPI0031F5F31C
MHLTVRRGEHLSIVGPSGSGKSTLLNTLGLLDTPTSGDYWLDGVRTGALSDRQRTLLRGSSVGFVFQSFHLLPSATGRAPAAGGAALAALRLLGREPERAARARAVAAELHALLTAAGLDAVRPDAAVVSVRAPSPEEAVRWAADCRAAGLSVGCFRPPSVPDGISRLRLTARGDLSGDQIERAVRVIGEARP